MKLRPRLALTLLLTAAPLLVSVAWVRRELFTRYEIQFTRDFVLDRAASLGRERCEAAPHELFRRPPGPGPGPGPHGRPGPPPRGGWLGPPPGPRPRPPLQGFTYDAAFRSGDAQAPPFPPELREALERPGAADYATRRFRPESARGSGFDVAIRTGWSDGPCAVILARRLELDREEAGELVRDLASSLPLLAVLLAAVLIAAGPVVQRIRALTRDVKRAADTRYETAARVSGHDEVAELARAFNDAGASVRSHVAAIEERERMLRAFLANTTHDVMIPLTVLQGHLSSYRDRLHGGGALDEAQLLPALQEAQYLASLIHNLGAAAKLEAGEPLLEWHAVDLNALVLRVVTRHRPVAEPAGVALEFGVPERPVVVQGDVTLLEQAVSNVVHNAVRYNRAGGHVAVLLEETAAPAGFRLSVVDDGPGLSDDEMRSVLERRARGNDARQRQPGGLGLGLHIARSVADRHGLRLDLARSEHGGLAVTLAGTAGDPGAGLTAPSA